MACRILPLGRRAPFSLMIQIPLSNRSFSSIQSYIEMAGAQVNTETLTPLMAAMRVSASIHQNHSACCQPVGGPDVSVNHSSFVGQRFCALINSRWKGGRVESR